MRRCPVGECPLRRRDDHLMCPGHWRTVPAPLRAEVWRTYRDLGIFSDEYRDARDAAIAAAEEASSRV